MKAHYAPLLRVSSGFWALPASRSAISTGHHPDPHPQGHQSTDFPREHDPVDSKVFAVSAVVAAGVASSSAHFNF